MAFSYAEERPSDSPLIEKVWRVENEQTQAFISLAESLSEIVVAKHAGRMMVAVRGPETKATLATAPADFECFGIVFKHGTFMPTLLPKNLMNRRDAYLPATNNQSFWLDSSKWEIPNFENADIFIKRLVREGLLAHDPVVASALQGHAQAYSPRALQYRVVRATGLSQKVIQQIDRAKRAVALLESGKSILDTVDETGYFDQAHLTNSLKRFVGQTPAQIRRETVTE